MRINDNSSLALHQRLHKQQGDLSVEEQPSACQQATVEGGGCRQVNKFGTPGEQIDRHDLKHYLSVR